MSLDTSAIGADAGVGVRNTAIRRTLAQARFEARMILRNGEQLLVTVIFPLLLLVGLSKTSVVSLPNGDIPRIDFVVPGVLALAIMTTAFTSQAIATAFDRRNGVLRLLATTPLGRGGLLGGKILGVLAVELVQIVVIVAVALPLGWNPLVSGIWPALGAWLLGTAAFTALAMLLAGTMRAEGVLAVANLVLIVLIVIGGVVIPPDSLPGILPKIAVLLPSGALGEAMRGAFISGTIPAFSVLILLAWTTALGWGVNKLFKWQ